MFAKRDFAYQVRAQEAEQEIRAKNERKRRGTTRFIKGLALKNIVKGKQR